ncbi:hypothetical protein SLS57_011726 [Botryosphaeria dothidea]
MQNQNSDETLPKCKKCERAGRRCVREPPRRFRHFNAPTQNGRKQIWLPIPPKVDFVDETTLVVNGIEDADSSQEEQDEPAPPQQPSDFVAPPPSEEIPRARLQEVDNSPTPAAPALEHSFPSPSAISPFSNHRTRLSPYASSPTYDALRELGRSQHRVIPEPSISIAPSPSQLSQSWLNNQWPLSSEDEAMLLRYFLDHVSTFVSLFAAFPAHHSDRTLPQFDLCEPYRFFRYEVPQRARTNKTLANAILAISARMMHWKTGYNPYVADRYYQLCLETLIPSLSDVEAVMDETLLAATVVLRMLEEMDVHVTGSDTQGHLTGSQAIISVASSMHADHPPTGLRRAAYWSAFRQEVWIAPQTQQPICMSPAVCGYAVEHAFAPAPDHVWCERSIAHCGAAMNAALMIDGRQQGKEEQVARWRALMEENERWWRCVPSGFDPFFGSWECREGELFPDVRFQADWHVMGYSYTIEAHLLLVVHDPNIPKLGPLRKRAVADVDTEKRHGWPTAKARAQLEEAWGWQPVGSSSATPVDASMGVAMTPPP